MIIFPVVMCTVLFKKKNVDNQYWEINFFLKHYICFNSLLLRSLGPSHIIIINLRQPTSSIKQSRVRKIASLRRDIFPHWFKEWRDITTLCCNMLLLGLLYVLKPFLTAMKYSFLQFVYVILRRKMKMPKHQDATLAIFYFAKKTKKKKQRYFRIPHF